MIDSVRKLTQPAAIGLILILTGGLALRLHGLSYGLPAVYNPDEVAIMARALGFATGDLNPHNFLYPTFYFYALFGWIGLYFVLWLASGTVDSLEQFRTGFFVDPSGIYLAGRALTALSGAATVWATYLLARRLALRRPAALGAALVLATSPIHVMDSHYVKHDVPATLVVVLAHLAVIRLLDRPEPRRVMLAGAACGLAIATHYYTVFVLVPLGLALAVSTNIPTRDRVRLAVTGATAVAVAFVLASPFVVFDWRTAWRDIVANREIVMDRATAVTGRFGSLGRYAELLWSTAFTRAALVVSLAGFGLSLRNNRSRLILLPFPAIFLLFIGNTVPATRYLNPVLPFMAVAMAIAVSAFSRARLAAMALVLICANPVDSARIGWFFRQDDTRTLAQRYIESTLPEGSTILIQPYSVPLRQSRAGLIEALTERVGDPAHASTKFALQLQLDPYPSPSYRLLYLGDGGLDADKIYLSYAAVSGPDGFSVLRRWGVRFVVLKRDKVVGSATERFARRLEARPGDARRLAAFSPYHGDPAGSRPPGPGAPARAAARPAPFLHNTDAWPSPSLARPGPPVEIWQIQ